MGTKSCVIGCASSARFYSLPSPSFTFARHRPTEILNDPIRDEGHIAGGLDEKAVRAHDMHVVCVCSAVAVLTSRKARACVG